MALRVRILLIVAAGLLLTTLALTTTGWIREQLLQERLASMAHTAQSSLWAEMLAAEDQQLDLRLDKLSLDNEFLQAARNSDKRALEKALIHLDLYPGLGQAVELVAILHPGQDPISLGLSLPQPLLDAASLDQVLTGEAVSGLRLGSNADAGKSVNNSASDSATGSATATVLSARLLPGNTEPVIAIVGRRAQHALNRLNERTGAASSLVDLRGQLLGTTNAELWKTTSHLVAPRLAQYFEHAVGEQIYAVNSTPINDLIGHDIGTLVTLSNATEEASSIAFLRHLTLGITVLLIATGLIGLYWYLGRSFAPLERAISALQALARGDTSVRLLHTRNDEIGRIAQAVATFRRNAQELARNRHQRERVRRRQERLIHTQLQQLAAATDMTSREEVMQLLNSTTPAAGSNHQAEDEQLRQLAAVMADLSQRIIDQHQRLTSMVVELREALVTKTRLAGLQQELQIASEVQRSILPQQLPEDARLQLHSHITPAREVGGDFYDYFMLDDEHLGLVIADVSGKGVPAALFMAITRTLLKATAMFVTAPSPCMRRLNDLLAAENEQMMFVTVFYGVLHLPTGQLRYVNAGHNPPYLLSANGDMQAVARTGGVAVAVSEDFVYKEGFLQLQPGDRLFLFTDGVTEAFNAQDEAFGEQRLEPILHNLAQTQAGPEEMTESVLKQVHLFENGAPQADDITCMSLLFCGSEARACGHSFEVAKVTGRSPV